VSKLVSSPSIEISDTATWPLQVKMEVARWLSDWHLVAFLCMQGLFSLVSLFELTPLATALIRQDEQKLLCRAATVHAHPDDPEALEHLFASGGWQTLLQIVESSAAGSGTNAPGGAGNETPSAAFEGMGIDSPHGQTDASAAGGGGGGDSGGERICPHCTYINEPGSSDCEVCGLPLSG
jgi:nuclear protein localization family protein 4